MPESDFQWGEFLAARARLIHYFREVQGRTWDEIAVTLSCSAVQVEVIYHGTPIVT
jgi:hypothetical protein